MKKTNYSELLTFILSFAALIVSSLTFYQIKEQTELQRIPELILEYQSTIEFSEQFIDSSDINIFNQVPHIKLINIGLGSAKNIEISIDTSFLSYFIKFSSKHIHKDSTSISTFQGKRMIFIGFIGMDITQFNHKSFLLPLTLKNDSFDLNNLIENYIKLCIHTLNAAKKSESLLAQHINDIPPLKIKYQYEDVFKNTYSEIRFLKVTPTIISQNSKSTFKIIDSEKPSIKHNESILYYNQSNQFKLLNPSKE